MAATIDTTVLVKRLTEARVAYYNHVSLMSDAQFDLLEEELRKIDPANSYFSKIGAPVPMNGAWPTVRHSILMTSLEKANNASEFGNWLATCKLTPTDTIVISMKNDGMSIELVYDKRRLVQGSTRGDGTDGVDITRNVLLMKGAVKMLPPTLVDGTPTPDKVYVRGEVIVLKSDFKVHFIGESNTRSSANGTAKRQTGHEKCQYLTIKTYQFLPNGSAPATKELEFANLKHCGFQTCEVGVIPASPYHMDATYQSYVTVNRAATDWDMDGLVIDINDKAKREALGFVGENPKGSIAYKYPRDSATTPANDVKAQVGSSGRITPVAYFDEVILVGARVKQATLHNYGNIEELVRVARPNGPYCLLVGDKIVVSRAGDVIPFVESVIGGGDVTKPIPTPTTCPCCGGPLVMDGAYLVCKNVECEVQSTGKIKRWTDKIEVKFVGDNLIEAVVEAFPFVLPDSELATMTPDEVRDAKMDIADLYRLDWNKVANLDPSGHKIGAMADKAAKNLKAKMTLPLHVLVGSLGIPLIGRDMTKVIVDAGFNTLSKMAKATVTQIADIPGMGDTKAKAFVGGFYDRLGLIAKLLGVGIQVAVSSGPLVGKSFCMTGFRDASLAEAIEKAGGTMAGGVSRKLSYLIALDPNGNSGKLADARKNGTVVIGIDDAWALTGQTKPV
jgi:DNA ligase (NAD+)